MLVVQRQLDAVASVPRRPHRVVGALASTDCHTRRVVGERLSGLDSTHAGLYGRVVWQVCARAGLIVGLTIHLCSVTTLPLVSASYPEPLTALTFGSRIL